MQLTMKNNTLIYGAFRVCTFIVDLGTDRLRRPESFIDTTSIQKDTSHQHLSTLAVLIRPQGMR